MNLLRALALIMGLLAGLGYAHADPPTPLLTKGHPVDWVFVYKFNSKSFPGCGTQASVSCPFGGTVQAYTQGHSGQQFVFASNENSHFQEGGGCLGDTDQDPVGATYDEVYNGSFHYVVWNDQFYQDPKLQGCGDSCPSPWAHSKGIIAWDDSGAGVAMQVSTPSWPGSGSANAPRGTDGNSLGCVTDNDVLVAQHFFAVRLSKDDVAKVVNALGNSSVVTDPNVAQVVNNGGPPEISGVVAKLGVKSKSKTVELAELSSGVLLISKPSGLAVPPWQLVSAELNGISLRVATWYTKPQIEDTTDSSLPGCWAGELGAPGPVTNARQGHWKDASFSLLGAHGADSNHAKIGASTSGDDPYVIFGDMNQDGALDGDAKTCRASQNGRGGLFFVVRDKDLHDNVLSLISER
jgi:hypothetical protein